MENSRVIICKLLKQVTTHQSIHTCIQCYTKYPNKQWDRLYQILKPFKNIYKKLKIDCLRLNTMPNCSILLLSHIPVQSNAGKVSLKSKPVLYNKMKKKMKPTPQYYSFTKLKPFYIPPLPFPYRSVLYKYARCKLSTWVHMDEPICKFIKLILISRHYPVSDKFDSKTNMSRCYCYFLMKTEAVFQPLDKMIKSSNIFLKLISTKDLHNYVLQ